MQNKDVALAHGSASSALPEKEDKTAATAGSDRHAIDDAIGYGRPPRGHRFAPGRSGNPRGRPRKHQAFKTLLESELAERVSVKEGGRRHKLSKRGVIVKRLVSEAMAGSPKHLALVLAQDPIVAEVLDAVTAALTRPSDAAVKADLIRRLRDAAGDATAEPPEPGDHDGQAG